MGQETVLVYFKFGQLPPYTQTHSSIEITRETDKVLELPELKERLEESNSLEHTYYNPKTDKLGILAITEIKRTANLSEF